MTGAAPGAKSHGATSHRPRWLMGATASAVSLAVTLLVLETVGWLWERQMAQGNLGWTLVASRRMPYEARGSDSRPVYALAPHAHYVWEGIPVDTNASGFRDHEWQIARSPETTRILNIGDSIPFGWRVRVEERYGNQLQARLNLGNGRRRFEVMTAAVPGWKIAHARNFFVEEGTAYRPDILILAYTVVNDNFPESTVQPRPIFDVLRDHTYFWPFLTIEGRFLMSRFRGPEAIPVLNPPRQAESYFPTDENDPRWQTIWDQIAEVASTCRTLGARLILVVFPTALQLHDRPHPDTPQRVLRRHAKEENIEIVDLLPVYRDICRDAVPGACEGLTNMLFTDVWMHPTAYGHSVAADLLSQTVGYSGSTTLSTRNDH